MDFSSGSANDELRPNRALVIQELLSKFIKDFTEQNPLSKLQIIVTHREEAMQLTSFQSGLSDHTSKLKKFTEWDGNASLQNSLELACDLVHSNVPAYARKEVLVVFSSLTSCDPSNIYETIEKVTQMGIRASVISLTAEVFVLKRLCTLTGGQFYLVKKREHFEEILDRVLVPTELDQTAELTLKMASLKVEKKMEETSLIKIGFPTRILSQTPQICACHGKTKHLFYACVQCMATNCELSTHCNVCSLLLVSSTKLSKTAASTGTTSAKQLSAFTTLIDFLAEDEGKAQ